MDFLEWLSRNEDLGFLMILASSGLFVATLVTVATTVRKIRLGESQLELKTAMIEQGLSSAEIERVLKA